MSLEKPSYEELEQMVEELKGEVHKRKQAEEALVKEKAFTEIALDSQLDTFFVFDPISGKAIRWNKSFSNITGYTDEEITSLKAPDSYYSPDDLEKAATFIASIMLNGKGRIELSLICKDGRKIPTEYETSLIQDQTGGTNYIISIGRDITERKRAEEMQRESEDRYYSLFNNMLNGFAYCKMIFDQDRPQDFFYLEVNKAFESLTGLKNVVGKKITEVIPGIRESNPELLEIYGRVARTGVPERFEIYVEALKMWFAVSVYSPGTDHFVAVFDVITERKRAEEAMRKSEEKYRDLLETTDTGYVILDLTGKVLDANDEYARLTGHERRVEILGRSVVEWTAEYDKERNAKAVGECVRQGFVRNLAIDYVGPQGQTIPIEGNGTFVSTSNGKHILALCHDITERKRAEEKLRESEKRLRVFLKNSAVVAWMKDEDGRYVFMSENFQERFGVKFEDCKGKTDFDLWPRNFAETFRRNDLVVLDSGQALEEMEGVPNLDGSLSWWWDNKFLFQDETGKRFVGGMGVDISDRKQSEEQKLSLQAQLQQSQKMEAIGQLAGGVAHDFNNLLTVISVQTQLGLRGLREGDPLKEKLKDIEVAADRAANLTRQLLAFSRRQILEMKVVNLNVILMDMGKILKRVIGEDIELKTILADDLGMVKVDPGQIEQVIVNLAVNAKDAMPQGGKLSLETANAELDEEYVHSHVGMIPGAYVLLSVSDSGVGMMREVQEQIFDPFFTTKEKGKGTGLGLSTVYGIVKQSGGDLYVDSEPGKGTTFKVYLPRVFEPQEELKKVSVEELPRGKETIVVVEDDRMVRRLAVDILRKQGYRVLEAEAGGEGLLICEQYKEPIDLILTDVVMPHMSGPEFIKRLTQVREDFKVLYMTGYTDETIVNHGILEAGINLIHKPFTLEKLARKVRKVLDKNSEYSV